MRVQAGLRREDWQHWGERATFKSNAAELLHQTLRQLEGIGRLGDEYDGASSGPRNLSELSGPMLTSSKVRPP